MSRSVVLKKLLALVVSANNSYKDKKVRRLEYKKYKQDISYLKEKSLTNVEYYYLYQIKKYVFKLVCFRDSLYDYDSLEYYESYMFIVTLKKYYLDIYNIIIHNPFDNQIALVEDDTNMLNELKGQANLVLEYIDFKLLLIEVYDYLKYIKRFLKENKVKNVF